MCFHGWALTLVDILGGEATVISRCQAAHIVRVRARRGANASHSLQEIRNTFYRHGPLALPRIRNAMRRP